MSTSLYIYLTPLIGLFFCYLILQKDEEEKTREENTVEKYLTFGYVVFTELNKGFYLFSTLIFFYLFYNLVVDWMKTAFKCKPCILVAFVSCGYLGVYGINNLLAYIMNEEFFYLGWEYGLYIIIDSFIAMVLFRDEML